MISQMLTEPTHGLVSQLSRAHQVSRQTLYRWSAIGRQALEEALGKHGLPTKRTTSVPILVLTLLIETHASYRGIQSSLRSLHGIKISLGKIAGIVKEAGQRAQRWMKQQQAETARALALDEQYSSQRGKAYLNVIDVHSGQVWATVPPVAVDGESWMLLCWYLREQGLTSECLVSDGGGAIHEALGHLGSLSIHQRDIWHLFQEASKVQGRLDRTLQEAVERLPVIERQARRLELGQKLRGRAPQADVADHQRGIERRRYVADGVRYLMQELHTLLEVVVLRAHPQGGILTSQQRQEEIETLLILLDELQTLASSAMQVQIQSLCKHLRSAMPSALLFAHKLERVQHMANRQLGPQAVRLLAWAWLRRAILGPTTDELVKSVEPAWQEGAQSLFSAWEQAVRASSVVENWHSIVRPHLAVHRTLSAGMLALLALWHNHRIAPRGLHEGLSPLQRTGSTTSQENWLAALGYSVLAA
jgi:hypothetical protein